jgi:hypothetical protein
VANAIRPIYDHETREQAANELLRLAAGINDLLGSPSAHDAAHDECSDGSACAVSPHEQRCDAIAWAFSDFSEALTRLEAVFKGRLRYRRLAASARTAATAVDHLEELWTRVFINPERLPDRTRQKRRGPCQRSTKRR